LPWDPQPLPQVDKDLKLQLEDSYKKKLWLLLAAYILACAAIVIFSRLTRKRDGQPEPGPDL